MSLKKTPLFASLLGFLFLHGLFVSSSLLHAQTPRLLICPAQPHVVKEIQQEWADRLGIPVEFTNSIGVTLKLVPPGQFPMGSPTSEPGRDHDERQRTVFVRKPFYVGVHEVTQQQYEQLVGQQPSRFSSQGGFRENVDGTETGRFPVESVSWDEAMRFCRHLTARERETGLSRRYRLPTEIQWEYACRAGVAGNWSPPLGVGRLEKIANYRRVGESAMPRPVGSLTANALGLYDMHGNVWEWCLDKYRADPAQRSRGLTTRVIRGGGWYSGPARVRSAERAGDPPSAADPDNGFRLFMDVPAMHLRRIGGT